VRLLDLFSGIGGFSLAAQWVWGDELEIVAFCEIDKFCQKVLKKHWPDVPIIEDVRDVNIDNLVNLCYNKLSNIAKEEIDMVAHRKDFDEAIRLYEKGLSIQNIADFYQVSRQAMWMILKRRGCQFRDHLKYGEENHFHRGTRASDRAQNLLEEAIEKGLIERKTHCEKCNYTGTFRDGRSAIQSHHSDYNKPLEVDWFCQKCHHQWHKEHKAVSRKGVMPDEVSDEETISNSSSLRCLTADGREQRGTEEKRRMLEFEANYIPRIDILTGGFP